MQERVRVHRQQLTLMMLMLCCQLLIACGRPSGLTTCRGPIYVHLESFDSAETGARAAVQRLSQEIHRCPEVHEYYIEWRWPGSEQDRGWRAVKYTREDKTSGNIGYEYDPSSGTREPTYLVEDSAVDQVAKEAGTLSDFAKYQIEKK